MKEVTRLLGKCYFVFLILVFFPGTGCFARAVKNDAPEKQVQDPFTWDFGKVEQGKVVTHEFILKNESKKILKITSLNTSCGCTASKIKKFSLAPGESTVLEVKFNSKGYAGAVQQYIYVNTDDPDNPVVRFIIKADVLKGG